MRSGRTATTIRTHRRLARRGERFGGQQRAREDSGHRMAALAGSGAAPQRHQLRDGSLVGSTIGWASQLQAELGLRTDCSVAGGPAVDRSASASPRRDPLNPRYPGHFGPLTNALPGHVGPGTTIDCTAAGKLSSCDW